MKNTETLTKYLYQVFIVVTKVYVMHKFYSAVMAVYEGLHVIGRDLQCLQPRELMYNMMSIEVYILGQFIETLST